MKEVKMGIMVFLFVINSTMAMRQSDSQLDIMKDLLVEYGIVLEGGWQKDQALKAVGAVALISRMLSHYDLLFVDAMGLDEIPVRLKIIPDQSFVSAHTSGSGEVVMFFYGGVDISASLIIHELGHVFDIRNLRGPSRGYGEYILDNELGFLRRPAGFKQDDYSDRYSGFRVYWFSSPFTGPAYESSSEIWADLFLGLVRGWWGEYPGVLVRHNYVHTYFQTMGTPCR